MTEPTPTSPQATMPRYVCHKTVHALKIVRIEEMDNGKDEWRLIPEIPFFEPIVVSHAWCVERKVTGSGYYVVYEDGYTSWSPAEAFEKGYTLEAIQRPAVPPSLDTRLRFAHARNIELTTALSNVAKTMQAAVALTDSVLIGTAQMYGFGGAPSAASGSGIEQGTHYGQISEYSPWRTMLQRLVNVAKYALESPTAATTATIAEAEELLRNGVALGGQQYTYTPSCGCRGFFHNNGCSDQNVLDPFGAIANPDHRARVREMAFNHACKLQEKR